MTLGTMNHDGTIEPYPSYAIHTSHGANCNEMVSVLRIAIDECRRLWVVDSGKIGSFQHCPPKLLIFDLATDDLIKTYEFPKHLYTDASLFISPVSIKLKTM